MRRPDLNIQGPGGGEGLSQGLEILWAQIVQIGGQCHHFAGLASGLRNDQPQGIGIGLRITTTGPPSTCGGAPTRRRTPGAQYSEKNGASRSRRFSSDWSVGSNFDSLEEPGRNRCRDRQYSVGGANPPFPQCNGSIVDALNSQALKTFDSAHDVHHGIDGADFVESHVLRGHTVDPAFLFRQQPEGTDGALAYPVGERCMLQRRDEIPHVVMRSVGLVRTVGVMRAGSVRVGFGPQRIRMFHVTARGVDRDLGGYNAATDYPG